MFLWYLANQNSFRELSDKFDVSQGAAHKVIVEVLDLTCLLASSFITWPTHCEKRTNAVLFRRACGIDGIVGAIDGCHIRIQLLGDTAYIAQTYPFIITPKRDNGALTVDDQQLNARISRGRVVVEQAFGRLKCKWRRLRDLSNTRVDIMVKIIVAACALHNMCTGLGEGTCNEHPHGCPREDDENQ
ncbi:hypothetical protein AAFF_G00191870 [Aldrovandia affinis]|uniref:DDE Tnp4 domain-containing protein n=1 Tax=Aldrovandia affinis TaxID=143900 RepID=A0AAD7R089_9TELE|nr:hypothetical protein AAFF_G00191870 [Aldrovandia affinis]